MNTKRVDSRSTTIFSERLLPSWPTFIWAAILFPSAYLVFLPINDVFGSVLGTALTVMVWAVMFFGSPQIVVADGQLKVGKAHIPISLLTNCREIAADFCFAERGPALDARAFVRFQMGVRPLVRLELNDPVDPTPYWLIATRRPTALLAALAN